VRVITYRKSERIGEEAVVVYFKYYPTPAWRDREQVTDVLNELCFWTLSETVPVTVTQWLQTLYNGAPILNFCVCVCEEHLLQFFLFLK